MERWGAKLIALFITFISILITTLLPIKLYAVVTRFGAKGEHLVGCLMCFSGGVFLGAYMLHMAPEVRNLFDEALFHPNRITYPVADCVMVVGFFMMIFFEILVRYLSDAKKKSKLNGVDDQEDDDTSLDNDDVFVSGHYRYMGARKRTPHETLGERFDRLANENHHEDSEYLGPPTKRGLLSSMSSVLPNRWINQSADNRCHETPSSLHEDYDVEIQQKNDRPKFHIHLLENLSNYEEFSEKTEPCYLHTYERVCTCVEETTTDITEDSVNRLTVSSVCTKLSTADSGMRGSGNDLRSEETLSSRDNSETELRERNYDREESRETTDLEVFEISRCTTEQDSASIDSADSKMSKDSLKVCEKKPCKGTNKPSSRQVVSEEINEQINEQINEPSRTDQVHYKKKRVQPEMKLNIKCKNCCKQRFEGPSRNNLNYDNQSHTISSPQSRSSSGITSPRSPRSPTTPTSLISPRSQSSPGIITSPPYSRATSRVSVDSLLNSPTSDLNHSRRAIRSRETKPRGKSKHVTIDSPIKTPHIFGYQLVDGVRIPLMATSKHTQEEEVEYEVKSTNSSNRTFSTVPRDSLNSEEGRRSKSERKRSSCQLVEETTSCRRYKMMKLVGNKQTDRLPSGSDKVDVGDTNQLNHNKRSHSQDTRSLTLLLALSMHNVFEGLSVGLKHSVNAVWNMCIAVIAHEIIISFGLGMQMVRTYSSMRRLVFSAVLCSSMVPLGIIVGLIMTETGALVHHSRTSLLTNGALQGLATGVFIYVTFFEILRGEMGHGKAGMDKMFFMMFGFIALALLALLPEDNPMTLHNEEIRPCVPQLVTGSAPNITK